MKSFITLSSAVLLVLIGNVHADAPGATEPGTNNVKVVVVKATDLHTTFATAKKAFVAKDSRASAAAISAAADMVAEQQAVAKPEFAAPLGKAVGDLNELAKSVGIGDVKDVKELETTFAATHQTLAEFYQGKAQRAYDTGDEAAAAKSMNAAANHVENGAIWAGTKLSDTAKGTVGLLRKVSAGILSGAGAGVENVGEVLGKGTKAITNVGKKVRGQSADPDANVAEKAAKGTQGVVGDAVEGAGKVSEKGTDAIKGTGKGLNKLGDAVKGEKKTDQ